MSANVLVVGGAGYIGQHVCYSLVDNGYVPIVLDNYSAGFYNKEFIHVEADYGDQNWLKKIDDEIDAIICLAAYTSVPESVSEPLRYYHNNVAAWVAFLDGVTKLGVNNYIFSSTAAVYGSISDKPVSELDPVQPESPYGHSKLMAESVLSDVVRAKGLKAVSLRYFNVAGADPLGRCGQTTHNATHLIKSACRAALAGEEITVFGADYPTPDGSGVRDYIHVSDLADVHVQMLKHLESKSGHYYKALNCGYGRGFSVLEILKVLRSIHGSELRIRIGSRRPGDVSSVVADCGKLVDLIGWRPKLNDIEQIVRSAYEWEKRLF